jgi:hypothetical protein
MEPESPLPHSQVPTTCPNPEPTPSSPHNLSHFLKIHPFHPNISPRMQLSSSQLQLFNLFNEVHIYYTIYL